MTILEVLPHLSIEELERRAQEASDHGEWCRWRAIALKAEGRSAEEIAKFLQHKPDWVRRTVRTYNSNGPEAVADRRAGNRKPRRLSLALEVELLHAVEHEEPAEGGLWTGAKVATWIAKRLGSPVRLSTAYNYLHRLNLSWKFPRPRNTKASQEAQEAFKKKRWRKQ